MRIRFVAVLAAFAVAFPSPAAPSAAEAGIEDDIIVRSFDGVPVVATLMLPDDASEASPVPAVLATHGWGGRRQTKPGGILGHIRERGYAVLTYDSRGFGESGGEANVGSVDYEAKDAGALIDYLATRPEILLDAPGDPRLGWVGGSNAGGVQFNTAAVDDRVDAIVPMISWGDLVRDLLPGGVAKQTWDEVLYFGGAAGASADGLSSAAGPQPGIYAPEIHLGHAQLVATGTISDDIRAWFADRSTTLRSHEIRAPTLIVQGSIDTLFPLEDGFENYVNLRSAGTPVKLISYCGGHTLAGCPYPGGDSGRPEGGEGLPVWQERVLVWLDRHVKDVDVDTGPEVEWQAQDGFFYGAPQYPLPATKWVRGASLVTGLLVGPGGSGGDGPAHGAPAADGELGRSAARGTVLEPRAQRVPLVGIPEVRIRGTVTGAVAHVFFELVDVAPDGTRSTIDHQTMPARLPGGAVDRTMDLHGVSWIVRAGHALELEVTTGSAQYQSSRSGPFAVSLTATPSLPLAPRRFASVNRRAR